MNRICLCCEKTYDFCSKCHPDAPSWKTLFDEEVCSVVFRTISDYNSKLISKEEVKSKLAPYNLTDFSIFKDSIAEKLTEIYAIEEIVKKDEELDVKSESEKVTVVKKSYVTKQKTIKNNINKEVKASVVSDNINKL